MSSRQPVVDLLDPPTLARALKSRAATQQACATRTSTSATDADADADATATRTALDAAEKCVALLRAELIDHNVGDGTDGDPPSAKRRAVERAGGQVVAVSSAVTTIPVPGVVGTVSGDATHTGTDTTTVSSTKTIHAQQPDGTWATTVVPCAPREIVVTTLPTSLSSSTLLHSVMESDLLQELVLGFLELGGLVALRMASMVVHEAMMDTHDP